MSEHFDYYDYINNLKEEKIGDEISKITKRMHKVPQGTPMFNQLSAMLEMAMQANNDSFARARLKADKNQNTALDIGEMESTVTEPEYDETVMLDIMVHSYLPKDKNT